MTDLRKRTTAGAADHQHETTSTRPRARRPGRRPYGLSSDELAPGDRQDYLDTLGVDFTFMSDDNAVEVAGWLSRVIERMLAEGEIGPRKTDREHAQMLVNKLRSEMQVRALRR